MTEIGSAAAQSRNCRSPPSQNIRRLTPDTVIRHFVWAGLDFMLDADGTPVLLEANRSTHMLGEYLHFLRNELPFELTAAVMNAAGGIPCLLWRRGEPFPDGDEDAPFIGQHLMRFLDRPPVICDVEDNQEYRTHLVARDGSHVTPGSIFRWWYGLPWSHERAGTRVINPNAAWVAVRDKLACYNTLHAANGGAGPRFFRVPRAFAVDSAAEAAEQLAAHPQIFSRGYVLKPRVGWGGFGVQVAEPGVTPKPVVPNYLLSERIVPPRPEGLFWEVRVFVMAGRYLGGLRHVSRTPQTNYWQGARPEPLDPAIAARLEPAALEAVALLDAEAERISRLPTDFDSPLTQVTY